MESGEQLNGRRERDADSHASSRWRRDECLQGTWAAMLSVQDLASSKKTGKNDEVEGLTISRKGSGQPYSQDHVRRGKPERGSPVPVQNRMASGRTKRQAEVNEMEHKQRRRTASRAD